MQYAALILADASISITPEKLQNLLKSAGIEDVEPIWTTLFAKALEGRDLKEILTTVTAAGPVKGSGGDNKGTGDVDGEEGIELGSDADGDAAEDSDEDLGNLFDL